MRINKLTREEKIAILKKVQEGNMLLGHAQRVFMDNEILPDLQGFSVCGRGWCKCRDGKWSRGSMHYHDKGEFTELEMLQLIDDRHLEDAKKEDKHITLNCFYSISPPPCVSDYK